MPALHESRENQNKNTFGREKSSWEKRIKLAHFYSTVKNMFFSTIPVPLFMVFNMYL